MQGPKLSPIPRGDEGSSLRDTVVRKLRIQSHTRQYPKPQPAVGPALEGGKAVYEDRADKHFVGFCI